MAEVETNGKKDKPLQGQIPSPVAGEGKDQENVAIASNGDPKDASQEADATLKPGRIRENLGKFWHFAKKPESTNVVMAVATVVIAVATVFTWREIKNGGDDTRKLAEAANTQAQAAIIQTQKFETLATTAGVQASAALTSAQATQSAAETAAGSLEVQQKALAASAKASSDYLREFIDANRRDQRAYLVIDGITMAMPKVGVTAIANIGIKDVGRTQAVGAWATGVIILIGKGVDPKPFIDQTFRNMRSAPRDESVAPRKDVAPGSTFFSNVPSFFPSFSAEDIALVQNDAGSFYVLGFVNYIDAFSIPHSTEYCVSFTRANISAVPENSTFCGSHNTIG